MIDTQADGESGVSALPILHWPICPKCGYAITRVDSTWKTKDGLIHRRRVCDHCGQWGFQTVERPESFISGNVPQFVLQIVKEVPTVVATKPNPVAEIKPPESFKAAENGPHFRKGHHHGRSRRI